MRRKTRLALLVAGGLCLLGALVFIATMSLCHWDFTLLEWEEEQMKQKIIEQSFESILITDDTTDIRILPSSDGRVSLQTYEKKNITHTVAVEDGTLKIELVDHRKWYQRISFFNFSKQEILLYLPKENYKSLVAQTNTGDVGIACGEFTLERIEVTTDTGDVRCFSPATQDICIKTDTGDVECFTLSAQDISVTTDTGDIDLFEVNANSLTLSVRTGDIELKEIECEGKIQLQLTTGDTDLSRVRCASLLSKGNTGDIELSDVIASGTFHIERSTGDVTFHSSDASEIYVTTDTGDVKGTLLTEKIFLTKTDTGNIRVPDTVSGGRCQIQTDTGDIILSLKV